MSYIQDDVRMLKSCIKCMDEDKIVDFLNNIEFKFDDVNANNYILQTADSKLITLYIDSYLQDHNVDNLVDMLDKLIKDNNISDLAAIVIKNKLLKQTNPHIIYQILNSNLVTWYNNDFYRPFISGFFDGENGNVQKESILNQDEVNVLFSIYAESKNWLKLVNSKYTYAKNRESLAERIANEWGSDYLSIQEVIERTDEEFVKDYFDNYFYDNMPDRVSATMLADMLIKGGIYR